MKLYGKRFSTPFGEMGVAVNEDNALVQVTLPNGHARWADQVARERHTVTEQSGRCDDVIAQLGEYFEGKRQSFELRLMLWGTDFQRSVWQELQAIPYGTTISYKTLATRIGNLAAIRAVGRANGQNPVPIIVPCHRVIGADGSLTGFGGGIALKEALLKLEGYTPARHEQRAYQPALFEANPNR